MSQKSGSSTTMPALDVPASILAKSVDELTKKGSGYYHNPPTAKFAISIRRLAYNTVSALLDILDNTLDAKAKNIQLKIDHNRKDGIKSITISDDGTGMDFEELDEALRLGSEGDKNVSHDLGTFGCGLKTASMSQGRKIEVITKSKDGDMYYSCQDLDIIQAKNAWLKELRDANKEEKALFKANVKGDSGTVIILSKLDQIEWKDGSSLEKSLVKACGQTFRRFLRGKHPKSIMINSTKVVEIDPFRKEIAKLDHEESIDLARGKLNVKIYSTIDFGQHENKEKEAATLASQGFYLMRNDREILAADTLGGVMARHPKYNAFRAELSFEGHLDDALSVDIKKSHITLSQSLRDRLRKIVEPYLKVHSNKNKKKATSEMDKVDVESASNMITKKLNLIETPEAEKETRKSPTPRSGTKDTTGTKTPRTRTPRNTKKTGFANKVRFEMSDQLGGPFGMIWNPTMEGSEVVVEVNKQHPFISKYASPEFSSPDTWNAILTLMWAMSNFELKLSSHSEILEMFVKMRNNVGDEVLTILGEV
jgi:hypothetical protein